MNSSDLKKAIGKPSLLKLKEVGKGIRVGKVLGERVLIRTITPFTEMDRVEEKSLLYIPETVREANTPRPSTGIVVQVGSEVDSLDIQPGTAVMFSRYAGSDVTVDEEEFRILELREIMCTLVPSTSLDEAD